MCRSGTGLASSAVRRLVAEELVEIAAVRHLAQPGQGPQSYEPLAYLAQGGIHGVLLGPGPKDLGGYRQGLLVNLYRRLHHGHGLDLLSMTVTVSQISSIDLYGTSSEPRWHRLPVACLFALTLWFGVFGRSCSDVPCAAVDSATCSGGMARPGSPRKKPRTPTPSPQGSGRVTWSQGWLRWPRQTTRRVAGRCAPDCRTGHARRSLACPTAVRSAPARSRFPRRV